MTKGKESVGKFFLSEFSFDDGSRESTLNIVGFDTDMKEISVAITCEGKVSVQSFDLKADENDCLYFEYGQFFNRIELNDFAQVQEGLE
ncbi:MAG: hypothetical protein FWH03_00930 [Firmicutes bacterium]|nr:hypothetical protein [Bacillota bacterium]